ncbi:MAG: heme lyase CcmF/NrfE family subunit [Chloroflexi bacterium]|nr:heme lyase CcmF/NrfE family subunit [Chloroflexota bacterium]
MVDIGRTALLLALTASIYSSIVPIVAIRRGYPRFILSARNGLLAAFALYTLAMGAMLHALLTNDFSIDLVAQHSSRDLPVAYKISALYAHRTGSLFFWGWLISLFAVILVWQKRDRLRDIMPYGIAILAAILAFFLGLTALVGDIFARNPFPLLDGQGLNPRLQNPGMLIHPPLLFVAYAAFSMVFAFAMGSLLRGIPGSEWVPGIRRWALLGWCALGLGNVVGAWWAYGELGWGGYWVWDSVENASFMPWLLATALLHSMALQRKRNYLTLWTMGLIVSTFAFTLFSPFVTQGGIASELHGFGGTPIVPYLGIALLVILMASPGILIAKRAQLRDASRPSSLLSREGAFLLTNIVLVAIAGVTLLLTATPKLRDLLDRPASVDRIWFDYACGSMLLVLVFLMGVCPLVGWRKSSAKALLRQLAYPLVPCVIGAIAVFATGIGNWYAVAAIVCGLPLMTILSEWVRGTRARHRTKGENLFVAFPQLIWSNRPRYGGFVVHIGIIMITVGVLGSSMYDAEKEITMHPGDQATIKEYTVIYRGLDHRDEMVYDTATGRPLSGKAITEADVTIKRGDSTVCNMAPDLNRWAKSSELVPEPAIRSTPADDLFSSLRAYDLGDGSATLHILVNPLVMWLWVGGGFMLLGGIIAFWPERRQKKEVQSITEREGPP